MTNLDKQINDAIKKDLPNQIGEALRERLTKADEDATELEDVKEDLLEARATIKQLKDKVTEYELFDKRNSFLEELQNNLAEENRNLELEKLKYQLEAEKDKTVFIKNVALGLVRNVEYRKEIFDYGQPVTDSLGGSLIMEGQYIFTETVRGDRTNIMASFPLWDKDMFLAAIKTEKEGRYRYGKVGEYKLLLKDMRLEEFETVFNPSDFTEEQITDLFRKEISEKYGRHAADKAIKPIPKKELCI